MIQKTFFIVPGFRMQPKSTAFSWLVKCLKTMDFLVYEVPIHWKNRTLTQNTQELINFYTKNKGDKNYILGFSFGAVLTFLTANKLNPEHIYLCSISPAFKEDKYTNQKEINRVLKVIGKRRFLDAKNRSAVNLAKNLKCKNTIFYGEEESKRYPKLKKRCEQVHRLARKSKLVVVENAPHKIDFSSYIQAIKTELFKI